MLEEKHALEGLRVLDFTWVYAGPFASRQLVDLGAEVIKIEPVETGALERRYSLVLERNGVSQSSYATFLNRGKKSLSVDLKTDKGLNIIYGLVKRTDIVLSNMAPGAMKKMHLGYEELKKINPSIIYCNISCFGHFGTFANEPGFDLIAQAASGWCGQCDPPESAPLAIGDSNAAMHATTAILAALYYRGKTGKGQEIDISMTDCLFHSHENNPPGYLFSHRTVPPKKHTRWSPAYSPYALLKGKDGYLALAALSDILWDKLVRAMGPDYGWLLTHERTNELPKRISYANAPFVHETLENWLQSFEHVEDAEKLFRDAGVPAMKVRGFEEICDAPYIQERQMLVKMKQPFVGEIETYNSPFRMTETPGRVMGYAPFLGEHNREVLSSCLGYDDETIDKLFAEGVIYKEPAVDDLPAELKRLEIC
ncbi:MAG: CoA transferase [Deltaproteobacteria bacterium]|nr:CoA transferase [Deltaproteobacteria bacterium]